MPVQDRTDIDCCTNTTTSITEEVTSWCMSESLFVSVNIILLGLLLTGIASNALLIATICYSPSLKTPPNTHLVNICANNLLICACTLCSFVSFMLYLSKEACGHCDLNVLGNLQLFLTATCFMQYCTIFSSIGYYRCKTVKQPSISVKVRSKIIIRSIVFGWLISLIVGVTLTASFQNSLTSLTWNPFQKCFHTSDLDRLKEALESYQIGFLYTTFFIVIFTTGIIIKSYYYILKTLFRAHHVCRNKVTPDERRTSSLTSDGNDIMATSQRSYKLDESSDVSPRPPFTVTNGQVLIDNFMVHYQKGSNSTSIVDEAFALENPLKAMQILSQKKAPLTSQLSNVSQGSTKTCGRPEFTDISPGAELHRFQYMKNKRALQNQCLRRDRIGLGGATKNSIIMISTFTVCSIPAFICSFPGLLSTKTVPDVTLPLLLCQLVFFLNAPAYPIWYLVFSKRVRKCLLKMYDDMLIKVKIKQ